MHVCVMCEHVKSLILGVLTASNYLDLMKSPASSFENLLALLLCPSILPNVLKKLKNKVPNQLSQTQVGPIHVWREYNLKLNESKI